MKTWLEAHRRVKVVATDQWYLDFVNELLPLVAESSLYWETAEEDQQQVALILALYLEDCVADGETGDNLSVGIRKVTDVTFLLFVDGRISA